MEKWYVVALVRMRQRNVGAGAYTRRKMRDTDSTASHTTPRCGAYIIYVVGIDLFTIDPSCFR